MSKARGPTPAPNDGYYSRMGGRVILLVEYRGRPAVTIGPISRFAAEIALAYGQLLNPGLVARITDELVPPLPVPDQSDQAGSK